MVQLGLVSSPLPPAAGSQLLFSCSPGGLCSCLVTGFELSCFLGSCCVELAVSRRENPDTNGAAVLFQ